MDSDEWWIGDSSGQSVPVSSGRSLRVSTWVGPWAQSGLESVSRDLGCICRQYGLGAAGNDLQQQQQHGVVGGPAGEQSVFNVFPACVQGASGNDQQQTRIGASGPAGGQSVFSVFPGQEAVGPWQVGGALTRPSGGTSGASGACLDGVPVAAADGSRTVFDGADQWFADGDPVGIGPSPQHRVPGENQEGGSGSTELRPDATDPVVQELRRLSDAFNGMQQQLMVQMQQTDQLRQVVGVLVGEVQCQRNAVQREPQMSQQPRQQGPQMAQMQQGSTMPQMQPGLSFPQSVGVGMQQSDPWMRGSDPWGGVGQGAGATADGRQQGGGDRTQSEDRSFKGLDPKFLPQFPMPNLANWKGRIDEVLGFRDWLESATSWLSLTHPAFSVEIRELLNLQQPLQRERLSREQLERSQRVFFFVKQAFAGFGRVISGDRGGVGQPEPQPLPDMPEDVDMHDPSEVAEASYQKYSKKTRVELELHRRRGHFPRDSRCEACKVSKSVVQHRRDLFADRRHSEVQADFFFLEDSNGTQLKFLGMRELTTGMICAAQCDVNRDQTRKQMRQFFEALGLASEGAADDTPVLVVTDAEHAVGKMFEGLNIHRRIVVERASPQGHERVGASERTVRIFKEAMQCIRHDMRSDGYDICLTVTGISNLMQYIAASYNRFACQKDGDRVPM